VAVAKSISRDKLDQCSLGASVNATDFPTVSRRSTALLHRVAMFGMSRPQDYASRGIIADTLLPGKLGSAEECSSGYRSKQPIASSGLARQREPLVLVLIYISVPGAL